MSEFDRRDLGSTSAASSTACASTASISARSSTELDRLHPVDPTIDGTVGACLIPSSEEELHMDRSRRITGPLKTWYDLHEAIAHEVDALTGAARTLEVADIEPFADRFAWFAGELRTHSEVEDGIMFPAIAAAGGQIDPGFTDEHHGEQLLVYDTGCALLDARVRPSATRFARIADLVAQLRVRLLPHLQMEEELVLPQVPVHFDEREQGQLLGAIIGSLPPDPRLQPWVAAALTSDHRTARLRNMASTLAPDVLRSVLGQIRQGVDADVWNDVVVRTPDLAALVDDDGAAR